MPPSRENTVPVLFLSLHPVLEGIAKKANINALFRSACPKWATKSQMQYHFEARKQAPQLRYGHSLIGRICSEAPWATSPRAHCPISGEEHWCGFLKIVGPSGWAQWHSNHFEIRKFQRISGQKDWSQGLIGRTIIIDFIKFLLAARQSLPLRQFF